MKRLFIIAFMLAPLCMWACSKGQSAPSGDTTGSIETPGNDTRDGYRIKFTVDGRELMATLEDNTVARSLVSHLPLTVDMSDFAQAEKIFYPPQRLTIEGTAAGADPSVGDIVYYEPWGNIAVFYRDAGYSSALYPMGSFDGSIELLQVPGSIKNVRIELVEQN